MTTKINYNQINGAVFNILSYGADATGVADSSAALALAITDAQTLSIGGTVFIPRGIWKLTSAINMTNLSYPISITGVGRGTQIKASGISTVVFDCTGSSDVIFKDVQISVASGTPQVGILFARSTTAQSLRCSLQNVDMSGNYSVAPVFNYCSEEFYCYRAYLWNQYQDGCAYFETQDNQTGISGFVQLVPGTGFATMLNTLASNTAKHFINCSFQVSGTNVSDYTDCVRIRGATNFSMDGCFYVPSTYLGASTTSRSTILVDSSQVNAPLQDFSLTNFRSEGGRKATDFIYSSGNDTTPQYWVVENGYADAVANLLETTLTNIAYMRWNNVIGQTATQITVGGNMVYCSGNYQKITAAGLYTCDLACLSTSVFTYADPSNLILFRDTGMRAVGGPNATTATTGQFAIPTVFGTPTGVPAVILSGTIPMQYDTANNFLYFYTNGVWKKSTVYS